MHAITLNMTDLRNITLERKLKAFERARDEANIKEGRLVLLSEEYYDAALTFARESFLQDEPINKAVKSQWCQPLADLWLETFRCNMTIAVLDHETNDVIAIRGTRVLEKDETFDASTVPDAGFQTLFGIIEICDSKAKFFETFEVDQAFHFFGFGVHQKLRQRGLGGRLIKTAIKMMEYLDLDSFCIKGETSSNFSSRIYESNGFVKLYEMPYTEYIVNGKQAICDTGEHKSLKIYGIQITP